MSIPPYCGEVENKLEQAFPGIAAVRLAAALYNVNEVNSVL